MSELGAQVFFNTNPEDEETIGQVLPHCEFRMPDPEILPLRMLVAVLGLSDLLISNDCGTMHVAPAVFFCRYVRSPWTLFRIHTIRTDRGHEFQAQVYWHIEDMGIRHVYIKPRSPQLNGKVERSHRTDKDEFYQLLTYADDVDLNKKLTPWENFYNFDRPHGAFNGKTPYEVMSSMLKK